MHLNCRTYAEMRRQHIYLVIQKKKNRTEISRCSCACHWEALCIYLALTAVAAAAALPLVLISYYSKMSPLSQNPLAVAAHAVRHLHWLPGLSWRTKPYHLQLDIVQVIIIHPNEYVRAAAADLSSEQKKNTSKHYQPSRKTGTIRKITHF